MVHNLYWHMLLLACHKMNYLLDLADVAGAMSLEGYQGSASPFRDELHKIRPFKGSIEVAERIANVFERFKNIDSHSKLRASSGSIFYEVYSTSSWCFKKCLLPFK